MPSNNFVTFVSGLFSQRNSDMNDLRSTLYNFLDALPSRTKMQLLLLLDLFVVATAFYLAFALRLNNLWPWNWIERSWDLLILLLCCSAIFGHFLNSYAIKLRSYEASSIMRSAIWAAIISLIGFIANIAFSMSAPRTVPIIFGLVAFFVAFVARLMAVSFLNWLSQDLRKRTPVAIYGAGSGGLQLVSALRSSTQYRPVLLLDDDKSLHRVMIGGLRVRSPTILKNFVESERVKEIFLAFPSLPGSRRNQILQELAPLNCPVSELPPYETILKSGGLEPALRPVEADDLLGRDGVDLDIPELKHTYAGKVVLVSGAGGSIGSELCRKILAVGPSKIVLFERSELALYNIEKELVTVAVPVDNLPTEIVPVLGSIEDDARVRQVLNDNNVDIILHAAAYKHVPLVESNKCEGVRNNVFGTRTLAQAAVDCGVQRFIMISTDKAVRPTGVMGASKRLAELVVQDIQSRSKDCVFGIVRFGNVLGSSGSVIPLFREQIKSGGPVTLTHNNVTRYFMSINEAAHLVLLAGTFAEGGEVFVLDMGEPVRIEDLAKRMITMSGLTVLDDENPLGDIGIEITGLREGEKLFEELLVGEDTLSTPHPKILRAQENTLSARNIGRAVGALDKAIAEYDTDKTMDVLKQIVEGFHKESS
ncbi:MAG: nucleoside-diphosphate sugar epimerase/dehydratase [Rhizobiaceae bacterium]